MPVVSSEHGPRRPGAVRSTPSDRHPDGKTLRDRSATQADRNMKAWNDEAQMSSVCATRRRVQPPGVFPGVLTAPSAGLHRIRAATRTPAALLHTPSTQLRLRSALRTDRHGIHAHACHRFGRLPSNNRWQTSETVANAARNISGRRSRADTASGAHCGMSCKRIRSMSRKFCESAQHSRARDAGGLRYDHADRSIHTQAI